MSKSSSNKISELKNLRKDGTSSKNQSVKEGTSSKNQSVKDGTSSKNQSVRDGTSSKNPTIRDGTSSKNQTIRDGTSSKHQTRRDGTSSKKNTHKDGTSSKQLSQAENNNKDDKISEIKSMNKDIIAKEENENQSLNQGNYVPTNEEKEEDKRSDSMMKENKEEEMNEDPVNNENNRYNENQSPNREIEDKTKKEMDPKKKKLLMTEVSNAIDNRNFFNYHDMIVPGGRNASLCLVNDPLNKNLRISDVADHYKFIEPQQVIVLIGANTKNKIKLFAGISRAALNTRAIILDSGLQTGIEKFCLRKNITLIGIAPENKIEYPKINAEEFSNTLLTNGHTHFILLGKDDKSLDWGKEARFKVNFAERLASGRKGAYQYKAKVVGIIFGNIPNCEDECKMFVDKGWPLILVEDSEFALNIKTSRYAATDEEANKFGEKIENIGKYQKLIEIDDDSENLAASIHLCLALTI